jgi:hypothetical protein
MDSTAVLKSDPKSSRGRHMPGLTLKANGSCSAEFGYIKLCHLYG